MGEEMMRLCDDLWKSRLLRDLRVSLKLAFGVSGSGFGVEGDISALVMWVSGEGVFG